MGSAFLTANWCIVILTGGQGGFAQRIPVILSVRRMHARPQAQHYGAA